MTRREWLYLSGSALLPVSRTTAAEPQNLSYPLGTLTNAVTPADRFFIRDHFEPPVVSLRSWRLRVEGSVDHPFELSYSDLVELPSQTLNATIECAGNVANGSAVSTGIWEGIPLASLLERAQPRSSARFVLLQGADSGRLFEHNPSALPYTQRVPLAKCLEPANLVAFQLNGRALPQANGFPARALLPGWYGMDSVKWLRRIIVTNADDASSAFEQGGLDRVYNRVSGSGEITRLGAIQVKSVLAWPPNSFKLPSARYTLWGFAWSGRGSIEAVEVSVDGGRRWMQAQLDTQASPFAWVKWTCPWNAAAGDYSLMSRATDASGQQQPLRRDPTRKDAYELNWCLPVAGSVR